MLSRAFGAGSTKLTLNFALVVYITVLKAVSPYSQEALLKSSERTIVPFVLFIALTWACLRLGMEIFAR